MATRKGLRLTNAGEIAGSTWAAFEALSTVRTVTQCWTWEGGEAVVGVIGAITEARTMVVVKIGEGEPKVIEAAGLLSALKQERLPAAAWPVIG